ncbi:hypothetical protein [Pseudomonas sp. HLMP]|uniref:hypothetical protein n=1 Tax=Pseudomonas sp. HLMP TaxID=3153767 RepID=UPI0039676604
MNKADASIVGNPQAYPTHGRFKGGGANYLQTNISESEEQTLIVVGRAVNPIPSDASTTGDESTPFYVGTYIGKSATPGVVGTSYGANLYHVATASLTGGASRNNGSGGATSALLSVSDVPTDWGIRVMRVSSSMPLKVQNITRNTSNQNADVRPRVLTDTLFRIGSPSNSASFGAEVDISFVAIHSVVLTDAELSKQVEIIRKRMARLGILV